MHCSPCGTGGLGSAWPQMLRLAGIDLPNLDLVVHAELPKTHETLLHRSGRTGRAGRKGVSALVVEPSSRKKAERILKFAKLTADWGVAPSADEVNARDQDRMFCLR